MARTDYVIRRKREAGRIRRANLRNQQQQLRLTRQTAEAEKRETIAARTASQQQILEARKIQKLQTQQEISSIKRNNQIKNAVVQQGVSSGRSAVGTVGLIIGMFFILIIMYIIIHNGQAFGSLTSGVATFIHGLSSNSPLFVAKQQRS